MSPWMPNGSIIRYTRVNPDANRLILVRALGLKIDEENLLTMSKIACPSVPGPHVSSRPECFAW